jgi:2-polyprenyl-3-methyl-5-hydroxy-6-metoxy-1,4-benzoquinol methylase
VRLDGKRSLLLRCANESACMAKPTFRRDNSGLYDLAVAPIEGSEPRLARISCSLCGSTDIRPRFAIEGIESCLVVCNGCQLGWLEPLPSAEQVASFYPREYYGKEAAKFQPLIERLVRLVGSRHIRFLCADLEPGARVLDVGCGRGVLLAELADRGFEVHGVEHSEGAVRGADPRARIRIATELADAGYPPDYFDEVIIWHVLEHLRHPRATVDEVRRIIRPGGRLIVSVPNFSSFQARWAGAAWFHLDPPRHLYHFSMSALRLLLEKAGFVIELEHHFSLRQNPFGAIQSALNRATSLPRNSLYSLLQWRVPDDVPLLDARTRFLLRAAMLFGAPFALAASVIEAWLRTGATVHVVARRPGLANDS